MEGGFRLTGQEHSNIFYFSNASLKVVLILFLNVLCNNSKTSDSARYVRVL